jgi:hypothetical protein
VDERVEPSAEFAVGEVIKKYLVVIPIWGVRYQTCVDKTTYASNEWQRDHAVGGRIGAA